MLWVAHVKVGIPCYQVLMTEIKDNCFKIVFMLLMYIYFNFIMSSIYIKILTQYRVTLLLFTAQQVHVMMVHAMLITSGICLFDDSALLSLSEHGNIFDFMDEDENTSSKHKSQGRRKKCEKSKQSDLKEKIKRQPGESRAPLKRNFEMMLNEQGDSCQHHHGNKKVLFKNHIGQTRHKTTSCRRDFSFSSSLVNASKEEKLAFDVEVCAHQVCNRALILPEGR